MSLFKVRRWVRLLNEGLTTLVLLTAFLIMFQLWWNLAQEPSPTEIQEEIRKSRKR